MRLAAAFVVVPAAILAQVLAQQNALCPIGRGFPKRYVVEASGKQFRETSYIAYSKQTYFDHPVMWMGSDGNWDEIAAVDLVTGKIIKVFKLNIDKRGQQGDWESIALGKCSSVGNQVCLYVGNTGNNPAHRCNDRTCTNGRSNVLVYKFPEPDVNALNNGTITVATLRLNYFHEGLPTTRADCESMFVDNTGDHSGGVQGDLYLVTKFPRKEHLAWATKVPAYVHENLIDSGEVTFSLLPVCKPYVEGRWTASAMSEDGSLIVLRDPTRIFFFPRNSTQSVGDALETIPCDFVSKTQLFRNERQFEAVSLIEKSAVAEASECYRKKRCNVTVSVYDLLFPPFVEDDHSVSQKEGDISTTLPPLPPGYGFDATTTRPDIMHGFGNATLEGSTDTTQPLPMPSENLTADSDTHVMIGEANGASSSSPSLLMCLFFFELVVFYRMD